MDGECCMAAVWPLPHQLCPCHTNILPLSLLATPTLTCWLTMIFRGELPGLRENLHRFAPAGHLEATIYCQKCHSLQSGLRLIYGLSPHFCPSVLNGLYGNGMTGVTKNTPAQTCRYIGWSGIYQMSPA